MQSESYLAQLKQQEIMFFVRKIREGCSVQKLKRYHRELIPLIDEAFIIVAKEDEEARNGI